MLSGAWSEVGGLNAILLREGLDLKAAISALDHFVDCLYGRPHLLAALGQLGKHLGEVDGADCGPGFNRFDYRGGARLVLQEGE